MFIIMLIKYSLGWILINVLETCTTVSKRSPDILWMICSNFLHSTCHRNSIVETKDKFEVLHLLDLISDVQFPSLFCSSLQSIGVKEILTCSIIWLLKYCHTIRWLNKILYKSFLCCCFVVDFLTRFLLMNKTCLSRYSDNVRAYSLYDIGPQMRMWATVVNPIGMG